MPEFALGYWGSQFSDKPGGQPPDVGPLWAAHPTSAPTYPTARSDLGFAQRGFLQARDQVWNGPSDQGTFPELCTLSDSVGSTCLRCGIIVQFERWWDRRGGKTRAMQMEFLWTLNIGRGTSKQSRVLYQKGTQFRIGDSGEESNSSVTACEIKWCHGFAAIARLTLRTRRNMLQHVRRVKYRLKLKHTRAKDVDWRSCSESLIRWFFCTGAADEPMSSMLSPYPKGCTE